MSCTITQPNIQYKSLYSITPDTTQITIIILATVLPFQLLCVIAFCVYNRCRKKSAVRPQDVDVHQNQNQVFQKQNMKNKYLHPLQVQNVGNVSKNSKNKSNQYYKSNSIQKTNKNKIQSTNNNNNNNNKNQPVTNKLTTKQKCNKFFSQIQASISSCSSKNKLICLAIFIILSLIASTITLGITIAASQQALNHKYNYAQCVLNSSVNNFTGGDNTNWIGLDYLVPNLTKLNLNLNTRVKATRNSITGLVLNGTNSTLPQFAIGFPNRTTIFDRITNVSILTTSVQKYIDVSLRQWLIANSTLSASYKFPICQNTTSSTLSNIPHPLNDGQTIQLDYMNSICNNLTDQVNALVSNGKAVDNLLVLTTAVQNNRTNITNNLVAYNSSLTGIALRSNQYNKQFMSSGYKAKVDGLRVVPFLLIGVNFVVLLVTLVYILYQYCKLKKFLRSEQQDQLRAYKHRSKGKNNQKDDLQQFEHINKNIVIQPQKISISNESDMSPSEAKIKRQARMRSLIRNGLFNQSKTTCGVSIFFMLAAWAIGLCSIIYTLTINQAKNSCNNFNSFTTGQKLDSFTQLTTAQKQLLTPVQTCLTNKLRSSSSPNNKLSSVNSLDHFLQSTQTPSFLSTVAKLYSIWDTYNTSTPTYILNSISLQQIQILKNYLLHMQTMPVKSSDFNMKSLLSQFNGYTNGTAVDSKQKNQCNKVVLRDQYVYNVADCSYTLLNYLTQTTVSQARCLQIPTWDGNGGSRDVDLNDAQHTIELNATCPTIYDFYNGTNLNCFLGKRLDFLRTNNCTITANQYNRRMKNLMKFSVQAASYTNSYLQNLRNYFGIYSVLSTNLTQFFNGANTTAILKQFGTLSQNLINKTQCSYIRSSINNIYNAYCPQNNSISMLMFDCFIWIFVSFGLSAFSWFVLGIWEIMLRGFACGPIFHKQKQRIEQDFNVHYSNSKVQVLVGPQSYTMQQSKTRKYLNQQSYASKQKKQQMLKRLQISQQTLNNQQDNQQKYGRRIEIFDQPPEKQQQQIEQHQQQLQANKNAKIKKRFDKKNKHKIPKSLFQDSSDKNEYEYKHKHENKSQKKQKQLNHDQLNKINYLQNNNIQINRQQQQNEQQKNDQDQEIPPQAVRLQYNKKQPSESESIQSHSHNNTSYNHPQYDQQQIPDTAKKFINDPKPILNINQDKYKNQINFNDQSELSHYRLQQQQQSQNMEQINQQHNHLRIHQNLVHKQREFQEQNTIKKYRTIEAVKLKSKSRQNQFINPRNSPKKSAPFFSNQVKTPIITIHDDSRADDFNSNSKKSDMYLQSAKNQQRSKNYNQRQRKAYSKAQNRLQTDILVQKNRDKELKSIIKLSKQGKQSQMLKIIQLEDIVKDTIDFVNLKEPQDHQEQLMQQQLKQRKQQK